MFTVTEDLIVPRRALLQMQRPSRWRWLLAVFGPGGGRGAAYVLAHMAVFLAAALIFDPSALRLRWLVAICAYICLFTGVPTLVFRVVKPARPASCHFAPACCCCCRSRCCCPTSSISSSGSPDVLEVRLRPVI